MFPLRVSDSRSKRGASTAGPILATALLAAFALSPGAAAHVYQYDNTTSAAIPTVTAGNGDTTCDNGTSSLNVQFTVSDTFTATSIAVGLNITHGNRGDIRARLAAPDGTVYPLITQSADTLNNYDIFLIDNTDSGQDNVGSLNDGDSDPTAAPFFNRIVNGISGLDPVSESANGTWTLRLCDRVANNTGTFNGARLALVDAAASTQVCTSRLTYDWGANGQNANFTSFAVGGITVTETTATNFAGAGANNFTTSTESDGGQAGFYRLYMAPEDIGGTQDYENMGQLVTFSFSETVQDLEFSLTDNDWANADFEDILRVEGTGPLPGYARYTRSAASGSPSFSFAGDLLEGDTGNDNGTNGGTSTYFFDRGLNTVSVVYLSGNEVAASGEPNDQLVTITDFQFCAFDFGDAPDTGLPGANYGTFLANDGARHILGRRLVYLGANAPDGETNGQDAVGLATADDAAAIDPDGGGPGLPINDEDGTESGLFPTCPNTGSYSMTVAAVNGSGGNAFLVGYIDWNRDGDFNDTGERSATTVVGAGATNPSVSWSSVPASCGGVDATYARFRISTTQVQVESPTGLADDGEVEDYEIGAGTLPVTLAWVKSEVVGGEVVVQFATATESLNAGFRLWGVDRKGARTLLGNVISETPDTFVPQIYEARVAAKGLVALEIEDLALAGRNRLHGPFEIGAEAGDEPVADAIDWASIKAEGRVAGPLDSFAPARRAFVDDAKKRPIGAGAAGQGLLLVREEGIHRVTHEDLLAAGIDLSGVPVAQIAVENDGVGVARHVESESAVFGTGSSIEFVAKPRLTLASPVDAYVLAVDAAQARAAGAMGSRPAAIGVTATEDVHRPDRSYSYGAPNGDPWYDQKILAWGSAASLSRTFDLPDFAGGEVEIDFFSFGYGDWQGAAPDHHIVVRLNGTEVLDERFDGITPLERTFDAGDLVSATGNVLEVQVPGDTGYDFDNTVFEGFTVRYERQTMARDGRFRGAVATPFAIGGFADDGGPVSAWRLQGAITHRAQIQPREGQVSILGGGTAYAAQGDAILRPGIVAGVPQARQASTAEYLIVTHPALAGAVDELVALEESRGLTTEVVTVDRIFAAYSDHASSAEAVRSFLAASYQGGDLRYVLLVGTDTTDPYDHLGLGSVSYVPTAYLPYAANITFSPTDEYLVDFDGDAVGEVAIGRLPVRTAAELDAVVAKLYSWEQRAATGLRSALLTSGASDSEREIARLNESYSVSLAGWTKGFAQVDDLGTAAVRASLLAAINAGTSLVSYVGHSSMGQWDFTPLVRWQDVASFTNAGAPSLITQWGCWNSYYVEPNIESLSARLLRQPDAGAAATIGAMTLTTDSAHRELGNLFFAHVGAGAPTVGDALLGAKRDLAAQGRGRDALLGMALLGDPAMSLPAVE